MSTACSGASKTWHGNVLWVGPSMNVTVSGASNGLRCTALMLSSLLTVNTEWCLLRYEKTTVLIPVPVSAECATSRDSRCFVKARRAAGPSEPELWSDLDASRICANVRREIMTYAKPLPAGFVSTAPTAYRAEKL